MRQRIVSIAAAFALAAGASAAEPSVKDLLDRGSSELAEFSFHAALPAFRKALALTTKPSEEWQHAAYGLAVCLQNDTPISPAAIAESAELYRAVSEAGGLSAFAARATLNLGREAELVDYFGDKSDLDEAARRYRDVAARWADSDIADEAALRLASALIQKDDPASAKEGVAGLEAWLARRPGNPLAAAMRQWLGDAYLFFLDDPAAAVRSYVAADELGLQWRSREGIVYWRIARLAEERLHDRDLAVRYYTKICEKAQTQGKAFEAQMALSRLGAPVPELTAFASYRGPRPALPPAGSPEPAPLRESAPTDALKSTTGVSP